MLCKTFILGSEIILLFISPAPMWYGHIAEVPHLNGDTVDRVFSTGCPPRRHLTNFYGQENMLVTGGPSFQAWPREFHPGSTSIFERGGCILPVFLFTS